MAEQKLTKLVVDRLLPGTRDYVTWCAKLPGFGCRVRPSGSKSFIAQYRIGGRNTRPRKVTLGSFGKLTVEQARDLAQHVLANAKLGEDIAAARSKQRGEINVAQLCDIYVNEGCRLKKPSTLYTDKGRINRHIKPLLGRKLLSDVSKHDIERFVRDIAAGKTAIDEKTIKQGRARVTGGTGVANRTLSLLSSIFNFGISEYTESNPCRGVKAYPEREIGRFLSPEEMHRLGEVLHEAGTIGLPWEIKLGAKIQHLPKDFDSKRTVVAPAIIDCIQLLLLTGCRRGEILNLRWEHVDLARCVLNLPDSKGGQKKVLLNNSALEIIEAIPRKGEYVIAGRHPDKPRTDIKHIWRRIRKTADVPDLRIHDCRHNFASVGLAEGLSLPQIGKLLGHKRVQTTSRYAHLADDAQRHANNLIGGQITAAFQRNSSHVRDED